MRAHFVRPVLVPLVLLAALGPARALPQASAPKEGALERFAAHLADYVEARSSGTGLDGARSALVLDLEGLRGTLGGHPLEHPVELGRALWLSGKATRAEERGGKVASAVLEGGSFAGAGMGYAFRLPRDYDPSVAYPLILAIPGEDEEPAEHIRAQWTQRDILERVILVSPAMPEREDWDRVMVKGRPAGLCHVLTGLRLAAERFGVDFERVFVAGTGKGVPAALAAGNYAPQRFAGVILRAGDAGALGPDNFSNLPTFFTGGGAAARAFAEAARAAGHDNSRFQVDGTEEDIWSWMVEHPRRSAPERVVLVPGDPFPTRAYWLEVSPLAERCRATAEIERGDNTIRIYAEGIAHATLFLNDTLVDLSKPVRVVANGTLHESLVSRSLASFLDMVHDGTSDPAAAYVARLEVDLTADAASGADGTAPRADAELEQRLSAAGSEVAKLWDLHLWCASSERAAQDTRVLRTLLRIDPEHAGAHEALGHVRDQERWFTSAEALERYRRSQDPVLAEARGLVEYRSRWMHPDERALAVKGWEKDPETGLWLTPADEKRLADGWVRQDLEWIPPAEAARVDEGLWWVDGEWLELARADRRHASIDAMWRIPGAEIQLFSTAGREVSLRAAREMERALVDMRRVLGAEPVLPLRVALLCSEEQYDRFAFGDPDGRRLARHAGRLHSVHSAFFAESWFTRAEGKHEFMGMGVCLWDSRIPNGDLYGVHAARLAAALSYVEALDPSPNAVRKASGAGPGRDHYAAYQAEKEMPAWLRWGAAVYAERYFEDTTVAPEGDRWWARRWSIENLQSRGGLRALDEVFAFQIDPDERDDALKLLLEAGLVVAFIVDGGSPAVSAEHAAFRKALAGKRQLARNVTALTEAVRAHEQELRAFAGPP